MLFYICNTNIFLQIWAASYMVKLSSFGWLRIDLNSIHFHPPKWMGNSFRANFCSQRLRYFSFCQKYAETQRENWRKCDEKSRSLEMPNNVIINKRCLVRVSAHSISLLLSHSSALVCWKYHLFIILYQSWWLVDFNKFDQTSMFVCYCSLLLWLSLLVILFHSIRLDWIRFDSIQCSPSKRERIRNK